MKRTFSLLLACFYFLFLTGVVFTGCGDYAKRSDNETKEQEMILQSDAVGEQTDAVGEQSDAVGEQTDAAGEQTDAAGELTEDGKIRLVIGAFSRENASDYELQSFAWLQVAVRQFNAENDEFQAEIKDYGDAADLDALYRLNAEIVSGQMPDLLLTYGMPAEKYAEMDVLTDLSGWVESDQCFTGPLEAMRYDGKLYWVSPHFSVMTFYGLKSVLGEKEEFSLPDLYGAWDAFRTGENMLIRQFNGYHTFLLLAAMQIRNFTDYGAAACSFDSEAFISLLDFCRKLPEEPIATQTEITYGEGPTDLLDPLCVKNEEVMLGLMSTAGRAGSVLGLHNHFLTPLQNEQIVYVGVPGATPAVPACMIELPLAVSEQTKHPDGAHAFLDSLWDIEYTGLHPGEMRRIPLMRPVLEEHIQYLKGICSRSFTDENGREYTAIVNMEGLLPYTDENIADFMKMADSACIAFPYLDFSSITRDPVMGIIQEEAAAFFSDTRTAEQAAKIIQARCAVYLQEQK